MRPERSTRSRKLSFPCPRRAITRPASRRFSGDLRLRLESLGLLANRRDLVAIGEALGRRHRAAQPSAQDRSAALGAKSGPRGRADCARVASYRSSAPDRLPSDGPVVRKLRILGGFRSRQLSGRLRHGAANLPGPCRPDPLRGLDLHDLNSSLEPRGSTTSTVSPFLRPMIALPTGDWWRASARPGWLRGADDEVFGRLLRVDVPQAHDRADRDDARVCPSGRSRARGRGAPRAARCDAQHHLLVLGVVVLGVLGDVADARAAAMRSAISLRFPCAASSSLLSCSSPSGVRITSFEEIPSGDRRRGPAGLVKRPRMSSCGSDRCATPRRWRGG